MRAEGPLPRLLGRLGIAGLILLLAAATLSSWALASPVGSSPDDDFHLASIWCADGYAPGVCAPGDHANERRVPRDLVVGSVCYAYHPKESAACQGSNFGHAPGRVVSTDRGNFAGQYPPVFYATFGVFAGRDVVASVMAMRFSAIAIFLVLLAAVLLLVPDRLRTVVVVAPLVTLVPLGLSLIPSTNPSGWAILGAVCLWPAVAAWFETHGPRRVAIGAVAVLLTVMSAGARADAAVYAGLAAVVGAIVAAPRTRRGALLSLLPLALIAISAAFYSISGQAGVLQSGFEGSPSRPGGLTLLAENLTLLPDLWVGFFGAGRWGLGWLDTAMPPIVWVLGIAILMVVVMVGIASSSVRKAIAVGLMAVAFLAIPLAVLQRSHVTEGAYLQPRYILPLAVMLVGVAVLRPEPTDLMSFSRDGWFLTRAQTVGLAVGVCVMNAVALQISIRRYVTGTDVRALDLDARAEWWWSGLPLSPNAVWVGGSLVFAALVALLVGIVWRRTTVSTPA